MSPDAKQEPRAFSAQVTLRPNFRQADGLSRRPSLCEHANNQEWREIDCKSQQCIHDQLAEMSNFGPAGS